MSGVPNERVAIEREMALRECACALWIALYAAQRLDWAELVEQLVLLHGLANDKWRELLDEGQQP